MVFWRFTAAVFILPVLLYLKYFFETRSKNPGFGLKSEDFNGDVLSAQDCRKIVKFNFREANRLLHLLKILFKQEPPNGLEDSFLFWQKETFLVQSSLNLMRVEYERDPGGVSILLLARHSFEDVQKLEFLLNAVKQVACR